MPAFPLAPASSRALTIAGPRAQPSARGPSRLSVVSLPMTRPRLISPTPVAAIALAILAFMAPCSRADAARSPEPPFTRVDPPSALDRSFLFDLTVPFGT